MSDGMNYAPVARSEEKVCEPFDFCFAAAFLDHGHIFGMCANLRDAGGTLTKIFEPDEKKAAYLARQHPLAEIVGSFDEILADPQIKLVAAAAIPNLRGPYGVQVMKAGKDYFTDKTPFTSLAQLAEAREVAAATGQKYAVCYSERLQNEAAEFAAELVRDGVVGDVLQVIGLGPHRLGKANRPAWFFNKAEYGGIICDIGSHQAEQFLTYTGSSSAEITMARVENFANGDKPGLEDFGEFSVRGSSGASGYFRMDWFTPDGLRNWGDGRTTILGTKGYIECRKYIDVAQPEAKENNVYIVTGEGEEYHNVTGKIGFPFFPAFIRDCLDRTEKAMTQEHAFAAAEICLEAQVKAES